MKAVKAVTDSRMTATRLLAPAKAADRETESKVKLEGDLVKKHLGISFTAKFPRRITHEHKLEGISDHMDQFYQAVGEVQHEPTIRRLHISQGNSRLLAGEGSGNSVAC